MALSMMVNASDDALQQTLLGEALSKWSRVLKTQWPSQHQISCKGFLQRPIQDLLQNAEKETGHVGPKALLLSDGQRKASSCIIARAVV